MRSIMGLFTTGAVMRRRIVMACAAAVLACAASAEAQDAERWQEKQRRAEAIVQAGGGPDSLLPPSGSTSTREYLGVEVHQGGVYEPSIFPTDSWLEIACIHNDLTKSYNRTRHGFSLVAVHALVYDSDLNLIWDTTENNRDYGICDVSSTVTDTFIELPRTTVGRRAAAVAFVVVPRRGQYIEAAKIVYRVLPR